MSKRSRQEYFHGPVRNQFVGMSDAVCLSSCPTSLAFRADCEDFSDGALVPAFLTRAARMFSRARSRP
eukprot:7804086-Pyramimonas_sp.AAC.1